MPIFSIIVPVYNAESTLNKCLDSILSSSVKDIEVICVNDSSSDNSLSYLKKYKDKDTRIKIISFDKNRGPAAARNAGLDLSVGKFIGFVDSDDFIDSDLLVSIINKMEETSADINIISAKIIGTKKINLQTDLGAFIKKISSTVVKMDSVEKLTYLDDYCWRLTIRRDFWLKNKIYFPEGISGSEDQCFWKPLEYKAGIVSLLDCHGYNYYWNPNSLTKREMSSFETVKGYDELMRRLPKEFHLRLMEKCYKRIYRFKMKNQQLKYELINDYSKRIFAKAKEMHVKRYDLPEYEIKRFFNMIRIKKNEKKKVYKFFRITIFKIKFYKNFSKFYLLGVLLFKK